VNTTLNASYGVNKFLVTYPPQLAALYPDHVRHTSFFGRLINRQAIVNLVPSLYHDDVLGGYVVEFDLRDPGQYHLQLGVSWYNGDSEPLEDRVPECVNGFHGLNFDYRRSSEQRSFVHWGRHLIVHLPDDAVMGDAVNLPRFGKHKCTSGEAPGRWINMGDKRCDPPFCTGDRFSTVNNIDWVRRYCALFPTVCVVSLKLYGSFFIWCFTGRVSTRVESMGVGPIRVLSSFVLEAGAAEMQCSNRHQAHSHHWRQSAARIRVHDEASERLRDFPDKIRTSWISPC
jgi:hypothetical protein